MRADILELLKDRPLWRLHSDREYRDILAAVEYAKNTKNFQAQQELESMLASRKKIVLEEK
jgi:hypothetical protein